MELFEQLRQTWSDPAMRHAAVVHLPVALSVIGVFFAIITALTRGRNAALVWTTIGLYTAMTAVALLAKASGANAEDALTAGTTAEARRLIHEHEELGEKVWLFALATGAVVAIAMMIKPAVRPWVLWLSAVAALATAGWVANTAHHGGQAVYTHGAGVKRPSISVVGGKGVTSEDPRVAAFVRDVKPILEGTCMKCHNPVKHKGGLDQTTIASMLKGGKHGAVIVPGNPDASLLIRAVRYTEPDDWGMPPIGKLKEEQIKALEKWVADGAAWDSGKSNPAPADDDDGRK